MHFVQAPPQLGNQYDDDRVLRAYLDRVLPSEMRARLDEELSHMGALAGGELYRQQLEERELEPRVVHWDAWGQRIDRVEVTPLWHKAERLAAELGVVATAYERADGAYSRVHQFALAYLFTPSTDLYSCPLAMSDGAARAVIASENRALIDHVVPRLTSRDPSMFWTSGQWMTEARGGSDVGSSETTATEEGGRWRLNGRKWFTSAIASQMALTLARPVSNPPGGKGLALFFVETRDASGAPNGITLNRLKDKLGTRKVPTAELELNDTPAQLVCGRSDGVKHIAPMLNITRAWNSVSAVSLMRRGIALARDYASRRVAFGGALTAKPLHLDTLAGLQAEFEAAFHLTFFVVELLGRVEAEQGSAQQAALLRILTPIAKLTTGRQAVDVLSEIIEAFGGAGYVEDTGLPALLRDAHVLPIWEGTTNVLALDALRAIQTLDGMKLLQREVRFVLQDVRDPQLMRLSAIVESTLEAARAWLDSVGGDHDRAEVGARRFALTIARTLALTLLARQAQWSIDHARDERPLFAATRFAAARVNLMANVDVEGSRILARDA